MFYVFSPKWLNSPRVRDASLSGIHDYTQTHHTRYDSSGRVISPSQRPLPDNTQHSQETDIRSPAGFEPTVSAGQRPQTYALDRAATGTGHCLMIHSLMFCHLVVAVLNLAIRNFLED